MAKREPPIIEDPDFPEFDGMYAGDKQHPEMDYSLPYRMRDLSRYADEHGKQLSELTKEEFEQFRIQDNLK